MRACWCSGMVMIDLCLLLVSLLLLYLCVVFISAALVLYTLCVYISVRCRLVWLLYTLVVVAWIAPSWCLLSLLL